MCFQRCAARRKKNGEQHFEGERTKKCEKKSCSQDGISPGADCFYNKRIFIDDILDLQPQAPRARRIQAVHLMCACNNVQCVTKHPSAIS